MLNIPVSEERLEATKARILEACKERDGRTNLRALNVWLAVCEATGYELIDLMLESELRGFEWWLLYDVGCSKNVALFVSIIRMGTAREVLAMIPVSMDTEPGV